MSVIHIDDSHDLYRSVREGEYTTRNGQITFSASAFNDRDRKPSVDTSALRTDPRATRKSPEQGVAKLTAVEVRKTSGIPIRNAAGEQIAAHEVDVVHRPIKDDPEGEPDNDAHCQVECHPVMDHDKRFKRLKEALAGIANKYGWVVQPGSP
ncbi:hypothetical protein E4K64_33325 [Bradyrhizobium frederickii]|uniref:Uncharacterized protein n=1 Tax=Bradyrhizobium frederickii TaxID=2560054 RepID=A0A4Y9NT00_9BRAD|nr:hypothetical protein [Bradyrhizobium frederickii]TFV69415.1 hypothetical protein E4K64_33325 [Bradyrhizobium frederickii]